MTGRPGREQGRERGVWGPDPEEDATDVRRGWLEKDVRGGIDS